MKYSIWGYVPLNYIILLQNGGLYKKKLQGFCGPMYIEIIVLLKKCLIIDSTFFESVQKAFARYAMRKMEFTDNFLNYRGRYRSRVPSVTVRALIFCLCEIFNCTENVARKFALVGLCVPE